MTTEKQKIYVEYPIGKECGLRCDYCFHQPLWEYEARYPNDKYSDKCAFTFAQYKAWRDKHFPNAEILMELHGGEMSFGNNAQLVLDIIDSADKERFQLQTNGLGDAEFYRELVKRKDKIDRIGFTYHRKAMMKNFRLFTCGGYGDGVEFIPAVCDKSFFSNVMTIKESGIKVYVKELLFLDSKDKILENKLYWESRGIEFRIQDFKGAGGLYATESAKYTEADWALVHPEYKHTGEHCHCREGYKQIIIRGYDQHAGDVIACWQDHKEIGNVIEGWHEPYECVLNDCAMPRGKRVIGKGVYHGDYMHDMKLNELEKKYYPLYQKESKMLAKLEAKREELVNVLAANETENAKDAQFIEQTIKQAQSMVKDAQKRIADREKTIEQARGGIAMTDIYIAEAKKDPVTTPGGTSADILSDAEADALKSLAPEKKKGKGKGKIPVVPPNYGGTTDKDHDSGSVNQ